MNEPADSLRQQVRHEVEQEIRSLLGQSPRPGSAGIHPAATTHPSVASPASHPTGEQRLREVVAIGADHGGYALKTKIAEHLRSRGFRVEDCGTDDAESCDYPVFARRVADRVASGEATVGIVIDGAGIGSCMVANKVAGVRAAHCRDPYESTNAREHNHANVLTLGAGTIGPVLALAVIDRFLATPFGPGRHARRVALFEPSESRAAR